MGRRWNVTAALSVVVVVAVHLLILQQHRLLSSSPPAAQAALHQFEVLALARTQQISRYGF